MSFGAYATNQSDWNFRKWLVPMLILSLVLHLCLMMAFHLKKLPEFTPVEKERLIPRVFNLKRAEIDPRALQNTVVPKLENVATKPIPDVTKLNLPSPKNAFEEALGEIRAVPAADDLAKPLLNEKPKIDPASINSAISQMQERSSHALEREMAKLQKELAAQKPSSVNQPALTAQGLTDTSPELVDNPLDIAARLKGENAGPDVGVAGFSDIDQLLNQTGPMAPNTAPLNFNSDTLYDYDSYILTEKAVVGMTKLGKLIQKYPSSTFVIEGYTDTFGAPDYNRQLSLARAETVKNWLIENMGINASQVETRGLGSSKLLVPIIKAGRRTTVEEQQLNRRVEIVIRTK